MYTRPAKYPEMQGRSSGERKALLKLAMESNGNKINRNFWKMVIFLLICTIVMGSADGFFNFPPWISFCLQLFLGVLFVVYLLWQINGLLHQAVKNTIAQRSGKDEKA